MSKGITVKEAREALKNLKQLTPARPKMDDELEMSLRETIFFMADDLIQKTKRGCTIKELVKWLSAQNISIKPGTLNRYLNEHQAANNDSGQAKVAKESEGPAEQSDAKSDPSALKPPQPPATPVRESERYGTSAAPNKPAAQTSNTFGMRPQASSASTSPGSAGVSLNPKSDYENLI